jgi:thiamine-phosphate pyrophosphorylase
MPIVAIGGIDAKNVADAFAAGASGVAVVSALFGSDDVELATRRIRAAIDEVLSQF